MRGGKKGTSYQHLGIHLHFVVCNQQAVKKRSLHLDATATRPHHSRIAINHLTDHEGLHHHHQATLNFRLHPHLTNSPIKDHSEREMLNHDTIRDHRHQAILNFRFRPHLIHPPIKELSEREDFKHDRISDLVSIRGENRSTMRFTGLFHHFAILNPKILGIHSVIPSKEKETGSADSRSVESERRWRMRESSGGGSNFSVSSISLHISTLTLLHITKGVREGNVKEYVYCCGKAQLAWMNGRHDLTSISTTFSTAWRLSILF